MPAVVRITSFHGSAGATESFVDSTSIRFKQADDDTVDATSPIPIVAATTSRSWVKHFKFEITTAPSNSVSGLKVYSDGAGPGTGLDIKAKTSATYLNPISNATTALSGSPSSLFSYTSGSALSVTGSSSTTGKVGDYIQMQFEVLDTATQGTTGSEVITFSYDES